MKVLIVYYSQTGNTQKIARQIRDGFLENGDTADLRFLKKVKAEELAAYDMIGFGSPIWYEMPPNMRRFVEEMPASDSKLAFSFCTHGTLPALYFPLVIPRLQRKGLKVVDWKSWYANCSIQIFPEPYYTAGHPDEQDLKEAKSWGKELSRIGNAVLNGEDYAFPEAPAPDMLPVHANAAIDHLGGFHNAHGRLVRDKEKCLYPKCHICMENCPMGYIDLEKGKYGSCGTACDDPHGCTYCEMLCPSGAIHPVIPYEEAAPAGQRHHNGLFCMVLNKAEEQGRFRRLVPEDAGETTPFYSVHPKHPRIKQLDFKEDE